MYSLVQGFWNVGAQKFVFPFEPGLVLRVSGSLKGLLPGFLKGGLGPRVCGFLGLRVLRF